MIESGWGRDASGVPGGRYRRALDVFDDYEGGGVLSEQLADDLCSELAGLGPRAARTARTRRATAPPRHGPHPSRPASPASVSRPRPVPVRGD